MSKEVKTTQKERVKKVEKPDLEKKDERSKSNEPIDSVDILFDDNVSVLVDKDHFGGETSDNKKQPHVEEPNINLKSDYRLDFNEITLEVVPEHQQLTSSALDMSIDGAPPIRPHSAAQEEPESGLDPPPQPPPPVLAQFHFSESVASEPNFSEDFGALADDECRLNHPRRPNNSHWHANVNSRCAKNSSFACSSERLTAKQQVALWLTKTSMADMSSVSSLRSLIFPSSHQKSKPTRVFSSTTRSNYGQVRSCGKSEIHRNFSTKSLINGFGTYKDRRDSSSNNENVPDVHMRKCETVLALAGSSNANLIYSSFSSDLDTENVNNDERNVKLKHSSLNLFKRWTSQTNNNGNKSRESKCSSSRNNLQEPHHHHQSGYQRPAFSVTSDVYGPNDSNSTVQRIHPMNRLRSTSSIMMCSHCTSFSFNNSRINSRVSSQTSVVTHGMTSAASMVMRKIPSTMTTNNMDTLPEQKSEPAEVTCKICLVDMPVSNMIKLEDCNCTFCKDCIYQYITFEVLEGAYDISCPDMECEKKGVLQLQEMEVLVGKELMDRHKTFRLNLEVSLDKNRAWCPRADCGTICHVCVGNNSSSKKNLNASDSVVAVNCPECLKEFCSKCSGNWHPGKTCQQYGQELVQKSFDVSSHGDVFINYEKFNGDIKPCPMCRVPIERDEGCAQMMCKKCKHVFCWFCQTSLDDDFLLRHYDSGACKGRLGHSRLSVLWHRAQVIGIFAGFGLLLLAASPLFVLTAPCILCCWCKMWDRFDNHKHCDDEGDQNSAASNQSEEFDESNDK